MKKLLLIIAVFFIALSSYAQTTTVWVKGYTKSDGTYVKGHYRTTKDNTNTNNWSTTGNTNPNTQVKGTTAKDYSSQASNYGSGKTIYTGPNGGQYYINSNGNKTYVPKQK
ncbi:MAG: hypothetical protein R3Y51_04900 [Rikenellaceae bacterium]